MEVKPTSSQAAATATASNIMSDDDDNFDPNEFKKKNLGVTARKGGFKKPVMKQKPIVVAASTVQAS